MRLKYFEEIANQEFSTDCPYNNAEDRTIDTAFRFTSSDPSNNNNYLPNFITDQPSRINTIDDSKKCSLFALSMFSSLDKAVKRLNSLPENIITKKGFTHISVAKITKGMGLSTTPEKSGHFDFFEFEGTDIAGVFQIAFERE
ncbi:hypothetical protein [Roseivirga thermotolerans]|jgi:hypothetical protein|uniref:hypothetical protein n=1 Tax=Roseivirga thermotolerans TaxID=1758176 RepID=UPI00273D4D44|nr:hypothetical protein [Roseivirga thermotolerans]